MIHDKTLTGLDRWYVQYECEHGDDTMTALVHARIPGSAIVYGICTMEELPCEPDDDDEGELVLIREGPEANRLRELSMIVHAPEMLDALRRVHKVLTGLVDGEYKREHAWERSEEHVRELHKFLDSEVGLDVWRVLCELQRETEDAIHEATDTDGL